MHFAPGLRLGMANNGARCPNRYVTVIDRLPAAFSGLVARPHKKTYSR